MVFSVFISYSKEDVELVKPLYSTLKQSGVYVYVAEFYPEPGVSISEKVIRNIQLSNCVLVLLTKNAAESPWVQQEIGIATSANRLIIPIVEKGVKITGVLEGKEHIKLDRENVWKTIESINNYTQYLKAKKEQEERARTAGIAILAIFAGLLFIAAVSGGD